MNRHRFLTRCVPLACAAAAIAPASASAALAPLLPVPDDQITFYGHGGWSADAKGPTESRSLDVEVPAGSQVEQAYLYGAFEGFGVPVLTEAHRTVTFEGQTVVLPETVPFFNAGSATFATARADVTSIVRAKVGNGGGTTAFSATGLPPRPLHGITLVVIYSNPALPKGSIAIMDGAARSAGDTTTVRFASPLDKTVTDFRARLSLGIGWSTQGASPQGTSACGGSSQVSRVTVSGSRLASCAGNSDDSTGSSEFITVGGTGDSTSNPVDPNASAGAGGADDELYDIASFLSQGATTATIENANPSTNDHIFLAIVDITADMTVAGHGSTPPATLPAPAPPALTSTGAPGETQRAAVTVPLDGTLSLLDGGAPVTTLTRPGVGTFRVVGGELRFEPEPGFTGTPAGVTYRITNRRGDAGTSTYTPSVPSPAQPAAPVVGDPTGGRSDAEAVGRPGALAAPAAAAVTCRSRRTQRLNWIVPRGHGVRSMKLVVGRRTIALPRSARSATADLRGLPAGPVEVRAVATTTRGRLLATKRIYRPCATEPIRGRIVTLRLRPTR